jgi:hypothetical protein
MEDKVTVTEDRIACPYRENCLKYRLRFQGMNQRPGQFMIESSSNYPLMGDLETGVLINGTRLVKHGSSIFYDVVPYEMLKTFVE